MTSHAKSTEEFTPDEWREQLQFYDGVLVQRLDSARRETDGFWIGARRSIERHIARAGYTLPEGVLAETAMLDSHNILQMFVEVCKHEIVREAAEKGLADMRKLCPPEILDPWLEHWRGLARETLAKIKREQTEKRSGEVN